MNGYLCGMMGSGKSTLGRMAAKRLGMEFRDLDEEADRRLGRSFHELVAEQGWVPFRELEYAICKDIAARKGIVFSLGGGTVRYQWNLDVLNGTGPIVLLNAPLEVLAQRLKRAQRPRVTSNLKLERELQTIWDRSHQKYLAAADLVIETHPKPLAQTAEELSQALQKLLKPGK